MTLILTLALHLGLLYNRGIEEFKDLYMCVHQDNSKLQQGMRNGNTSQRKSTPHTGGVGTTIGCVVKADTNILESTRGLPGTLPGGYHNGSSHCYHQPSFGIAGPHARAYE
jgi:hypothetical protein